MKLPTDLQILNAIYERYYEEYSRYDMEHPQRNTKLLVPIDIAQIASDLKVDDDIVFGRLYYHLEQKYGYEKDNGKSKVAFFRKDLTKDGNTEQHVVNFPLLASVLAELRYEHRQYQIATILSVVALVLAAISITVSFVK